MTELDNLLDEYLRVGINHYLVTNGLVPTFPSLNTNVHTARQKVIELYHPNGPGTPGRRFEYLMMELEKLVPDPEPFSAKAPEGRYLEEIRKLKLALETERNNANHWKAMYYNEYRVELALRDSRPMTSEECATYRKFLRRKFKQEEK